MLGDLRERMILVHRDVGVRLVVAQRDVVARGQALDEIALEEQRLAFGVGGDDLELARLRHHALQTHGQPVGLGVVGDPALKVARLADIERRAVGREHAVDAGAARHGRQRSADHRRAGEDRARVVSRQKGRRRLGHRCCVRHSRPGDMWTCSTALSRPVSAAPRYPRKLWIKVFVMAGGAPKNPGYPAFSEHRTKNRHFSKRLICALNREVCGHKSFIKVAESGKTLVSGTPAHTVHKCRSWHWRPGLGFACGVAQPR